MNIIRWFLEKMFLKGIEGSMVGKTVIHFTSHGCMGTNDEFDYIGVIIDIKTIRDKLYYEVDLLKNKTGEKRDGLEKTELIPCWYLQNMGNFYIAYD